MDVINSNEQTEKDEKNRRAEVLAIKEIIAKMSDKKLYSAFKYLLKSNKTRIHGKPYTIYPKHQKTGDMYYVEFRQANGKFGVAKSTGERTKGAAETWALNYLHSGQIVTRENITFQRFATQLLDPKGLYIKDKEARWGKISSQRLKEQKAVLENHLYPTFGNYMLTSIDSKMIAKYQIELLESGNIKNKKVAADKKSKYKKGLSGGSVNAITTLLKDILTEAYKQKLLHELPIIERVSSNSKHRDVLSMQEVSDLFKLKWTKFSTNVLNENKLNTRAGNLLAASSGLRQGEIIGLKRSSIHKNHIEVTHSWNNIAQKLKSPKTAKSKRIVPIPTKVYDALIEVMDKAKYKDDDAFIFQSEDKTKPMNPELLRDSLYEMLEKMGVDRKGRNIAFHSWRHFFNSMLINKNIPMLKVQSLTGHTTDAMSKLYYHPDAYKDVLELQNNIFI